MKVTLQISIEIDLLVELKQLTGKDETISNLINRIIEKHLGMEPKVKANKETNFAPASPKSNTQDTDIQYDDSVDENNPLFTDQEIKQAKFNKLKGLLTAKQPFKSTIEAIKAV
jgi:hypothetical protein